MLMSQTRGVSEYIIYMSIIIEMKELHCLCQKVACRRGSSIHRVFPVFQPDTSRGMWSTLLTLEVLLLNATFYEVAGD